MRISHVDSCNNSSFVEHSAQQPCRSDGMFMATELIAMGYNDSSHVGLKVQSVLFPVSILVFIGFLAGMFLLSKAVVLGLLFLGKHRAALSPLWIFSKSLSIILPANTAYSSSKSSCKLNSRMNSTNFTADQLI